MGDEFALGMAMCGMSITCGLSMSCFYLVSTGNCVCVIVSVVIVCLCDCVFVCLVVCPVVCATRV